MNLVVVRTDPLHPGLNGLDPSKPFFTALKRQKIVCGLHFLQENVQGVKSDKLKLYLKREKKKEAFIDDLDPLHLGGKKKKKKLWRL